MTVIDNQSIEIPYQLNSAVSRPERSYEYGDAAFWLGIVASQDGVMLNAEYMAATVLRADTYIDKWHFLPESARNQDGGETDEDDERSTHFVAIAQGDTPQTDQVVGNLRLIHKRSTTDLLPVEKLFPESFRDQPAPVGAVEASRFISDHPDKFVQGAISLGLIRAVVMQAHEADQQPIYAVVEQPLERRFKAVGLPLDRIGEPKPLEDYNMTENMALRFIPEEIIAAARQDTEESKMITSFFKTAHLNRGLGYYDGLLLQPYDNQSVA